MDAISFFLRTLAVTVVVVLLMQVRWGAGTIEDHAMGFMTSSTVVRPIDDTAKGAVIFIRNTWTKITKSINTNFSQALRKENQPGSRLGDISIARSREYVTQRAQAARETASQAAEETAESTEDFMARFKQKAAEVNRKVRKSFIDETEVPGQKGPDKSLARSIGSEDEAEQDSGSSASY